MNPVIIIPTTYAVNGGTNSDDPVAYYDHPSRPGHAEELDRCLRSLRRVQDVGVIVVLVSAQRRILRSAVETVEATVNRFPDLNILVVAEGEHTLIHERLEQLGAGNLRKEIGLTGYAAIRNLGLVVANVLGFDSVVFLDDDEVVDDPDFLHKAVYGLGKLTRRGVPILAKTGFYYNRLGKYTSMSQNHWYNHFWEQGKAFNQWIEGAMRGPRLSRSNHVCGGCLALHAEAYKRMAFDPWIPRGEDLDYMLDLRMYGSTIWFDNQWSLVHMPPKTANEGERFLRDIYRWIYEFRKVEYSRTQIDLLQITPGMLEPYPGPFLRPGITRRAKMTAFLRAIARSQKGSYLHAARATSREATEYAKENCSRYFEFQFIWPEMMQRSRGDRILTTALLESMRIRRKELGLEDEPQVQPHSIDPGATGEIRLNIAE
jgi:hypothetical protein